MKIILGCEQMEFMTTKQAAKLWNISQRRVALLCEQGRIKGVKKAGIVWLIRLMLKNPVMQKQKV